jgi:uncharacterized protein (UPF0332 family)
VTASFNELIDYRFRRARETLEEAKIMAQTEHWHGCVNRLYYACFYAVTALLVVRGLSSSKHTGVRALFSTHFVRTGLFPRNLAVLYNTLFDTRQENDYDDFIMLDSEEVLLWLDQAHLFIEEVARLAQAERSLHQSEETV